MIQLYFWDYLKRANMRIRKSAQNSADIFVFSMLQLIQVFLFIFQGGEIHKIGAFQREKNDLISSHNS